MKILNNVEKLYDKYKNKKLTFHGDEFVCVGWFIDEMPFFLFVNKETTYVSTKLITYATRYDKEHIDDFEKYKHYKALILLEECIELHLNYTP